MVLKIRSFSGKSIHPRTVCPLKLQLQLQSHLQDSVKKKRFIQDCDYCPVTLDWYRI